MSFGGDERTKERDHYLAIQVFFRPHSKLPLVMEREVTDKGGEGIRCAWWLSARETVFRHPPWLFVGAYGFPTLFPPRGWKILVAGNYFVLVLRASLHHLPRSAFGGWAWA